MPKEYARSERVAQSVNRHLAIILRQQVRDSRIAALTITEVQVSKDLRQAKVYLGNMLQDDIDVKATMQAVDRASGFLRKALAEVIDMRHCPSLSFSYDNSIAHSAKISALIDQANSSDGQDLPNCNSHKC